MKQDIKWYETCKCKCRLYASVCNNKQRWNKCRCECKEFIDKGTCGKGFIWNPSNCECISISSVFIYFYWCLKRKYIETVIYGMQFY